MNSVFLVKEGYPDFDVRAIRSSLDKAKAVAELLRGSYATLIYIIEEWVIDAEMPPRNIWQLEGTELRQVLKDGEYILW
jgi:hypothetical protein